jgi:hypothetical protein
MPRFKVPIWGEGLERARQALHGAGIETTAGPNWLRGVRRLGVFRLGRRMTALLDAATARKAEDRVRDKLPEDDYTVGQAKPCR